MPIFKALSYAILQTRSLEEVYPESAEEDVGMLRPPGWLAAPSPAGEEGEDGAVSLEAWRDCERSWAAVLTDSYSPWVERIGGHPRCFADIKRASVAYHATLLVAAQEANCRTSCQEVDYDLVLSKCRKPAGLF